MYSKLREGNIFIKLFIGKLFILVKFIDAILNYIVLEFFLVFNIFYNFFNIELDVSC